MKSLETLIKLQKTRVDEQHQALAKLQDHLQGIEKKIAGLEISKAREQLAAQESPEARMTYGAFLKMAVHEGRELEKQRHAAQMAVEIARLRLAELFEEQKRYEIAQENRLEKERQAENRRETIEMDEIGSVSYTRNKD